MTILSVSSAVTDYLGPLLGRAHEALRAQTMVALADHGIGVKEFGALAILVREGPASQRALGARQGIDRTTMVAVLDALETKGLAERRPDPGDRRAHAVHPTAAGRRVFDRAQSAILASERGFLAPLPAPDRERLKALLRALL